MKKIALILAVAFPLTTGMALATSFASGLLPLLSTDACFIDAFCSHSPFPFS